MKVTMIDCTGFGRDDCSWYAASLMAFTKSTRLNMSPGLKDEIEAWSIDRMDEELNYMARTIPSSWEFVNYTVLIEGVTRAFTHQLVRTRTASFAQQTMRVLDVDGWEYEAGPTISNDVRREQRYRDAMAGIDAEYRWQIDNGAKIEDARGLLPTNIHTNIVASFNLRTIAETLTKRASIRTQGEYRTYLDLLRDAVIGVHPWAHLFVDRDVNRTAQELEAKISESIDDPIKRTNMIKLVDELRKGSV